jgi:hypothetical protein
MSHTKGGFVGRLNSEVMKKREISLRNTAVSQKGHEMTPQRLINRLRFRSLSTFGNLLRFPERGNGFHKCDFLLDKPRSNFEKSGVFRANGHFFEILREYSKKVRFIQKGNSSQKRSLCTVAGSLRHPRDYTITRVNTKEGSLLRKAEFPRQVKLIDYKTFPRLCLPRSQ